MSIARPQSLQRRRLQRFVQVLRGRFALLFVFLLVSIIVYPYAESSGPFGYYAFRILGAAVILLTVYAVAFSRGFLILILILAIPSALQHIILPAHASGVLALMTRAFTLLFDLLVIVLIFVHVFQTERPDAEIIFGALCIYLLLGFFFAGCYAVIDVYHPSAFYLNSSINVHSRPDRFDFIYYSFGTLTELGAPGITAVVPIARSVSLVEAVSGILYLAVLISRLLSAYRPAEITEPNP